MAQVFHFTKDQAGLHSSFGELQRRLKDASKQKGIESSIANALWSQEGHAFVPGFLYLDEEDPRLTAAEIAALFSLAHNAQGMELLRKSSYGALFVGSEPTEYRLIQKILHLTRS